MKTPKKAKANILKIAEENGYINTVQHFGIDWVWEEIKESEDILTPYDQLCLDVLKRLSEKRQKEIFLQIATIFFGLATVISFRYGEGSIILMVFMAISAFLYSREVL